MAFSTNDGMYMPVAPAYGNGGGFGFGGDGSWLILFLIIAMAGYGGFGGFGMGGFGGGLGVDFPWLLNGQNNTDSLVTNGFDHAATQSALNGIQSSITSGFGDVQTALCGGFAGTTAAVTNAQNAIAQQMYANQIADMERSFNAQTASTQGMNAIQGQIALTASQQAAGTADIKYTIANEACASRATRTANTQAILDKLCALELENVKAQVAAERRENDNLRTELMYARGQASQIEQTAQILQGQTAEVDALYNRLNNCPVSTVPVYGKQPIFQCGNNGYGCGCGA